MGRPSACELMADVKMCRYLQREGEILVTRAGLTFQQSLSSGNTAAETVFFTPGGTSALKNFRKFEEYKQAYASAHEADVGTVVRKAVTSKWTKTIRFARKYLGVSE